MKVTFTFVSVLFSISAVWANVNISDLVDTTNYSDSTDAPPVPLNENSGIDVRFGDMYFFAPESNHTAKDTFIFVLNTTNSTIPKNQQLITLNVTGLRSKVDYNLNLTVSACDWRGMNCYPSSDKDGFGVDVEDGSTQVFNKTALEFSNTTTFNVSDFGTEGEFFYIYLQIQKTPGQDNSNYDDVQGYSGDVQGYSDVDQEYLYDDELLVWQNSDAFNRTVNSTQPDDIALTFSLEMKDEHPAQ